MKTKLTLKAIEDLNDYFVGKLISGDFEFVESSSTTVLVKMDSIEFQFWVQGGASQLTFYDDLFSLMNRIKLVFTEEQQKIIYKNLEPYFYNGLKDQIEKKERELNELKDKLNESKH